MWGISWLAANQLAAQEGLCTVEWVTAPSVVGRDSSVGIVTRYGLGGPEIQSRWWWDFPQPVQTHPASYKMGTGSFLGVKRPGCGVDHPSPSSAEVKERVELYLYSYSGPSWPVLRWTLLYFNFTFCNVTYFVDIHQRFGGIFYLHLQSGSWRQNFPPKSW
jgi:hypothetical protein